MLNDLQPVDSRYAPWGILALRFALGAMWIGHGLLKILVFTVAGFAQFLESQGFPAVLALPVIVAEIGGGLAILLGFHARLASLALTPLMLAAAWTHLGNGWLFTSTGGGWEYPIFLAVASLALALLGDGALALRGTRLGRAAASAPMRA